MFADGTINNCNGVIKEVRLNAVVVAPNGSVEDSLSAGWEITPKPRGVTKYDGGGFFIGGSHNKRPPALLNMNHVNAFEPEYTMRACAYEVDDYERNIAGYTFYTIITAHNKKGREIARYVSPPVACDQNG
jgi:hypothetical protein